MAHLDPEASHHLDRHGHVGLRDQLVADHDVNASRPLRQGSCHEQRCQVLAADRAPQLDLHTGDPLFWLAHARPRIILGGLRAPPILPCQSGQGGDACQVTVEFAEGTSVPPEPVVRWTLFHGG